LALFYLRWHASPYLSKKLKILFQRERAREGGGSEEEADSLLSREPDAGLDPRTLGS